MEASKQIGPVLNREDTQSGSQGDLSGSVPAREVAYVEWRDFPACPKWSNLASSYTECGL